MATTPKPSAPDVLKKLTAAIGRVGDIQKSIADAVKPAPVPPPSPGKKV